MKRVRIPVAHPRQLHEAVGGRREPSGPLRVAVADPRDASLLTMRRCFQGKASLRERSSMRLRWRSEFGLGHEDALRRCTTVRERFDSMGKEILRNALECGGTVVAELSVGSPDAQAIDTWFESIPGRGRTFP